MKKYLLIAFCVAIISCKSSTDTGTLSQGVIMPLTIGNSWTYDDSLYDQHGVLSGTMTDTLRLTDTMSYGNVIIYIPRDRKTYYVNRADGLRIRYDGYFDETFVAKYPSRPGDIFRHDQYIITKEPSPDPLGIAIGDLMVSSTNESVTVPAGTFICYKYNEDFYDTTRHQLVDRFNTFYAPNVGMIKSEDFHLDSASQTLKIAHTSQLTKVILH